MIGVTILVAGLALPFTLQELDRRRETEVVDRLGLLIRLARTESRSSGVPMEVRCDASGRRISVLRVDPEEPPVFEVAGLELEPASLRDRALRASWSVIELPPSLRVVPAPEDEGLDSDLLGEFDPALAPSSSSPPEDRIPSDEPWLEPTRLLLLVPDGTAISIEDFGLLSSRGWRRLRVDPWTAATTIDASSSGEAGRSPELDEEASRSDGEFPLEDRSDSIDDDGAGLASDPEIRE